MTRREEILRIMELMRGCLYSRSIIPVPADTDKEILELMQEVTDQQAFAELKKLQTPDHYDALLFFGARACVWAVVEKDKAVELLIRGLVALCLLGLDKSDVAFHVPLYGRSAYLLGISRDYVFEQAAQLVDERSAGKLREYVRIAEPNDKPLRHFSEVWDDKGFRYEFKGWS